MDQNERSVSHERRPGRREFLVWASKRGIALSLGGASLPALLAACGLVTPGVAIARDRASTDRSRAKVLVGDVVDFALRSNNWKGTFGFVTLRLHRGIFDGNEVFFIRTDASDAAFARQEKLVFVPLLAPLTAAGLTGSAYFVSAGTPKQAAVLSTEPGRHDYTPAWRIHRVTWKRAPRTLSSVADVETAQSRGDVLVDRTDIVMNAPVVKWSSGQLAVDTELTQYLGPGQLLEPPDTRAMKVTFKLHECFPGERYFVTDVSMKPMAQGMNVVHSPRLGEAPKARATGRVNVFMNGLKGPGPMGFQPSVFDSAPPSPSWSPYWDHATYAWKDGRTPRLLTDETFIRRARDAGELDEFPGTPDTKGTIFTVNCPVPILAPNSFTG